MAARLELRDVVVRRGPRTTLTVDRLLVDAGEVLAVIGPNGAGKSTLLQVAGLLLRPFSGQVLLDGQPVTGDTLPFRRRMAVAMQEALLVEGSVVENVALGLKLRGVKARERRERAMRWLQRFGIAALAQRPASKLSGGEAQRASLARAFSIEPELLLLDEPFGGLDQPLRQSLLDDLASVLAETGVTTIFVTHDRNEALRLADGVAVLLDARLRQVGPTSQVFRRPVSTDVAAFVGVENLLPGRVTGVGDGLASIEVAGQRLVAAGPGLPSWGDVVVCLRPEDVQLISDDAPAGAGRNRLAGVVREVRPRGVESRVVIDCGFVLVVLVPASTVEDLGLRPGSAVTASFRETTVHLLPVSQS